MYSSGENIGYLSASTPFPPDLPWTSAALGGRTDIAEYAVDYNIIIIIMIVLGF